jgi:hypothetical protein
MAQALSPRRRAGSRGALPGSVDPVRKKHTHFVGHNLPLLSLCGRTRTYRSFIQKDVQYCTLFENLPPQPTYCLHSDQTLWSCEALVHFDSGVGYSSSLVVIHGENVGDESQRICFEIIHFVAKICIGGLRQFRDIVQAAPWVSQDPGQQEFVAGDIRIIFHLSIEVLEPLQLLNPHRALMWPIT